MKTSMPVHTYNFTIKKTTVKINLKKSRKSQFL